MNNHFIDRVQQLFGVQVNTVSFFGRKKVPKVEFFATGMDCCRPFIPGWGRAQQSASAITLRFAFVLGITLAVGCAEINQPIIRSNTVTMVDLIGPSPMHVQPCKSVGAVKKAVYSDEYVPVCFEAPSSVARGCPTTQRNFPCEQPGSWAVGKQFPQPVYSKRSHDDPPMIEVVRSSSMS